VRLYGIELDDVSGAFPSGDIEIVLSEALSGLSESMTALLYSRG